MLPLAARDPRHRDDDNSVGRQLVRFTNCGASAPLAKPEIRYPQSYGADTSRIDDEPLAKKALCVSAVGDDFGPRSENAGAADREALEECLSLVDLGAVYGHQHAGLRTPPGK